MIKNYVSGNDGDYFKKKLIKYILENEIKDEKLYVS